MEDIRNFLLISVVVIFILVFYRWILRMMRNREIVNRPFPYVYPFSSQNVTGHLDVKVDMPYRGEVRVEMRCTSDGVVHVVYQNTLDKGEAGFVLKFNGLSEGEYTMVMIFPDEVVRRFVHVRALEHSLPR